MHRVTEQPFQKALGCLLHLRRCLGFDDDFYPTGSPEDLKAEFAELVSELWLGAFLLIGIWGQLTWEWVLPGWISRYLPGSNWQPGYPKCLAEIPPGYKSLLVKCLTSPFQQGAVQSFPDSWDTVSHTHVRITQWHFSATLFTRWYKYKNISSHLTPCCFFLCIEHFRETGEGMKRQNMPHTSWHADSNHIFHISLHCFMYKKWRGLLYSIFVTDVASAAAMWKQRPFHQHVHCPCSDNHFYALDSRGEWADLIKFCADRDVLGAERSPKRNQSWQVLFLFNPHLAKPVRHYASWYFSCCCLPESCLLKNSFTSTALEIKPAQSWSASPVLPVPWAAWMVKLVLQKESTWSKT